MLLILTKFESGVLIWPTSLNAAFIVAAGGEWRLSGIVISDVTRARFGSRAERDLKMALFQFKFLQYDASRERAALGRA